MERVAMINKYSTIQSSTAAWKNLVSSYPLSLKTIGGGKEDFEELFDVSNKQSFEYEYPAKKKEESVIIPQDSAWYKSMESSD